MGTLSRILRAVGGRCKSGRGVPGWLVGLVVAVASSSSRARPPAPVESSPFQVRVVGKGAPVLLIPGLASSSAVWDGLLPSLCAAHECHLLNLAGFAGVPAGSDKLQTDFLALEREAVVRYLRAQRLSQVTLIGHSLGGALALAIAEDQPELVGRVVVLDALPFLPAAGMPAATVAMVRPQAQAMADQLIAMPAAQFAAVERGTLATMVTSPKDVERVLAWTLASDRASVAHAMQSVMTTDLRPGLSHVRAPTLVLGTWAGYQPYRTREQTLSIFREQYAGLRGVKIALADRALHFLMLDDEPWVQAQIAQFLGDDHRSAQSSR